MTITIEQTLLNFVEELVNNQTDIDQEFVEIVNKNFYDLLEDTK